ncbi:MAG: proteasome assembly chaperone family protein [Candidatus Jordarchaeum sp.]|uniref:proteasome assembly chaperone family protein n=1 Tax=Candidatus Jordarchaeum sp. TaxID=2823881 RepID=UPI00404A3594
MSIEIKTKENIDLKDCIFITGFHSIIGETGYIAVRHLTKTLQAERIGYIETPLFPPITSLENFRLTLPFEIFKNENLVILFPRMLPYRAEQRKFTQKVTQWIIDHKLKEAILIGGLDNQFKTGEEDCRVVPTTTMLKKAQENKLPLLEEGLQVFGPLALMLTALEIENFPALAILSFAQRGRPDPRAAATAIEKINKLHGYNIPTTELIRDAHEIEEEIEKIIKQQEDTVMRREPREDMYI